MFAGHNWPAFFLFFFSLEIRGMEKDVSSGKPVTACRQGVPLAVLPASQTGISMILFAFPSEDLGNLSLTNTYRDYR